MYAPHSVLVVVDVLSSVADAQDELADNKGAVRAFFGQGDGHITVRLSWLFARWPISVAFQLVAFNLGTN